MQTSPAGRTSLGQVGHIRKYVFVISADMGIRGKASSLPRRLFSLSRAGRLSKPREDKQCSLACRGPVYLLAPLSLYTHYQSAIPQWLIPILFFFLNVAFIALSEPCQAHVLKGYVLNYAAFLSNISAILLREWEEDFQAHRVS